MAPIKIGNIEVKNRMTLAPMNETMANDLGQTTEQMIAYYAARAKGGIGLTITGAISATRKCSQYAWGRNTNLFHVGHLQGHSMLAGTIHYFGSLACAQMLIGWGRQGHAYDHRDPYAPTAGLPYEITADRTCTNFPEYFKKHEATRHFLRGQAPREMTIAEIQEEQKEYAASCQYAVVAGYDMIEVHGPHGYLTHEFLSPFTNKRTDMYGGEWRNRKRFINDMVEKVRYACPGAVLGVRISAEEHFEGGLTPEEMVDVALDLQARGADYISLSDSAGYEECGLMSPSLEQSKHIPDVAAKFRTALKIPVMAASQHDPVKADADIGAGKFDISALGRQLFIDPEYPNKVLEGRLDEINICRRCNVCLQRCILGLPPNCPFNPNLGYEYTLDEYKRGPRKRGEALIPKGVAGMPFLNRPWWKPELPIMEKSWRRSQGLKTEKIS